MKNILCRLNIHRPLKNHHHTFTDCVSGKTVFDAECPCGLKFMVDSQFGFCGFKVAKTDNQSVQPTAKGRRA